MCDVALDPYTSHGHDGLDKNQIMFLMTKLIKVLIINLYYKLKWVVMF